VAAQPAGKINKIAMSTRMHVCFITRDLNLKKKTTQIKTIFLVFYRLED
jgi:hypothetical protein